MDTRAPSPRQDDQLVVHPRLWRSRDDRMLAGVMGGLAERLDVSGTGMRAFAVVLTLFTGVMPGLLAYVVLWMITRPHDNPRRLPRP